MMTMMTKALDALKIAGSTRGSALGFPANSGGGGGLPGYSGLAQLLMRLMRGIPSIPSQ